MGHGQAYGKGACLAISRLKLDCACQRDLLASWLARFILDSIHINLQNRKAHAWQAAIQVDSNRNPRDRKRCPHVVDEGRGGCRTASDAHWLDRTATENPAAWTTVI